MEISGLSTAANSFEYCSSDSGQLDLSFARSRR